MVSAKSYLYEFCAAKHWRPPRFELHENEGPSHRKLFTYKVTVEIKEERGIEDLECVGNPLPTKKTAKENAAEGALWWSFFSFDALAEQGLMRLPSVRKRSFVNLDALAEQGLTRFALCLSFDALAEQGLTRLHSVKEDQMGMCELGNYSAELKHCRGQDLNLVPRACELGTFPARLEHL
ncbi:hypothetical protein LguiA_028509 [Lonicera macranthoides]